MVQLEDNPSWEENSRGETLGRMLQFLARRLLDCRIVSRGGDKSMARG